MLSITLMFFILQNKQDICNIHIASGRAAHGATWRASRRTGLLAGRSKDMFIRGQHYVYPGLYEPVIADCPALPRQIAWRARRRDDRPGARGSCPVTATTRGRPATRPARTSSIRRCFA